MKYERPLPKNENEILREGGRIIVPEFEPIRKAKDTDPDESKPQKNLPEKKDGAK